MYTIIGTIIVAIGAYVIYYGSTQNDKKTQKEITDKIEQTQLQIETLKSNNEVDQKEVEALEDEFSDWAQSFVSNREKQKVELEKNIVETKASRAELEIIGKPRFKQFLKTTKNLIEAYEIESGDSVEVDIPDLPEGLFLSGSEPYSATVFFRKNIVCQNKHFATENKFQEFNCKFSTSHL